MSARSSRVVGAVVSVVTAAPVLAALAAAFVTAFLYGPALTAGGVLVPIDMLEAFSPWNLDAPSERPSNGLLGDQVQQMYPWRVFVHRELAEGRFPLWNPWSGGGSPLFANGQAAVLFPLNLLTLPLHPAVAATVVQVLKPVLAAAGLALFLQALGVGRAGSVFGGLAWAFAGPMVTWLGWPHTNALAVLPYLFWSAVRFWQRRTWPWAMTHVGTVAVQLFGGHPETSAHSVFVLGVFLGLWSFPGLIRRLRPATPAGGVLGALVYWLRPLVLWVGLVGLGAALAAVQVIPLLEAIGWSIQAAERSTGAQASVVLEPETLLTWLLPGFFGTPLAEAIGPLRFLNYNETIGYVGTGTLVLALIALGAGGPRAATRSLAVAVVVSLGLTYGWPVITEIRHLPGLAHAANTRFLYLAAFGLAALGGIGLDALLRRRRRWAWSAAAGLACAMVGASWLAMSPDLLAPTAAGADPLSPSEAAAWRRDGLLRAAGLLGGWFVGVALLAALPSVRQRLGVGVVMLALGLDLGSAAAGYNPVLPGGRVEQVPGPVRFMLEQDPGARVVAIGDGLLPNASMLYSLYDMRVYEPVAHRRMLALFEQLDPRIQTDIRARFYLFLYSPDLLLLDLLGVRWVLLPTHDPQLIGQADRLRAAGFRQRFDDTYATVWDAPAVTPRAYLASRAFVVDGDASALAWVLAWTPARRGEAVRLGGSAEGSGASGGRVLSARYGPGWAEFETDALNASLLAYHDTYYPGWAAWVDGRPVPVVQTNYLFMGADVPAGRHVVRFAYEPVSFRLGLGVSLLALLGIIVATSWWAWRCRRQTGAVRPSGQISAL